MQERSITVKDVVRQSAIGLLTKLTEEELNDITSRLINGRKYKSFVQEMEKAINEVSDRKLQEGN